MNPLGLLVTSARMGSMDERAAQLNRIEQDLADVEVALARLDAGTYWTCEVTGQTIPDERLALKPTARQLA